MQPFYMPSADSYEHEPDFIFDSNLSVPMSYTLDATPVAADSNGDKIVRKGTMLSLNHYTGLLQPESANTYSAGYSIMGPLLNRVNLRFGDVREAILFSGIVLEDFLIDRGVFGTVPQDVKNRLGDRIQFVRKSTQAQ